MSARDRRRAELHQLWIDDPSKIIGIFRFIRGLDEFGHVPKDATFGSLIDAILDHEEAGGKLTDDSQID